MRYHRVHSPDGILRIAGRGLARTALLLWCVLSLLFVLVRLAPGDPASMLVAPGSSAIEVARMRTSLGLDRSMATQYARWVGATLRGDFGSSFVSRRPVTAVLGESLPVSIWLGGVSLLFSFVIGALAGVVQAARKGTRTDAAVTVASVVLTASPAYWLALGAIACFTYGASMLGLPQWMRLPAVGMTTPGLELRGAAHAADLARHALLPLTLLTAIGAAGVARYVRTSALDLIDSDWMRTAQAKGLSSAAALRRHLLANLRVPLLTLAALALPGVVAGSVFVETIFGWPGVGRLMVTSIVARDYPVVLACAAAYGALVIVANLVADLLLPWADPRVTA